MVKNGKIMDKASGLVSIELRTKNNVKGSYLSVVNVKLIMGIAHLMPTITELGNAGWIVKNRIDFKTFNDIY